MRRPEILELHSTQRRWRALSKLRVFLSLAASPLLPVCLGLLAIFRVNGGPPGAYDTAATALGSSSLWSLLIGSAYLFVIGRWRRVVGRIECFLLGIGTASSLPFAVIFLLGHDEF